MQTNETVDRRIRLVCFDLDGTIVSENSWYRLKLAFGVTPGEDQELCDAYYAGTLGYADWIQKLETLYRERGQATRATAENVFRETKLCDGAEDVIRYLSDKGYVVVLVTGSFDVLAEEIAKRLSLPRWGAVTTLDFGPDDSFLGIVSKGEEKFAKVEILGAIAGELETPLTECVCVGDDMNDSELFRVTGGGITFTNAPVKEHVWRRVPNLAHIKTLL